MAGKLHLLYNSHLLGPVVQSIIFNLGMFQSLSQISSKIFPSNQNCRTLNFWHLWWYHLLFYCKCRLVKYKLKTLFSFASKVHLLELLEIWHCLPLVVSLYGFFLIFTDGFFQLLKRKYQNLSSSELWKNIHKFPQNPHFPCIMLGCKFLNLFSYREHSHNIQERNYTIIFPPLKSVALLPPLELPLNRSHSPTPTSPPPLERAAPQR